MKYKGLLAILLMSALSHMGCANAVITSPGKQIEKLNRGVVSINLPTTNQRFISWRALATDPSGTTFNVYRGTTKITATPTSKTNWLDSGGSNTSVYTVKAVVGGVEQAADAANTQWTTPYKTVPVQKPTGGTTPDGVAYTYEIGDGSPADLDGDGTYEIVFRWQPTNAQDPANDGYTGPTLIDAYKLDGTRLWRINLGINIRSNSHYNAFVVYDLDGDGKAELMVKTADGTVSGTNVTIGSSTADYRNSAGRILTGPEFLTVFNGLTGAAMQTVNYLPARGTVADWGDTYGNRVDRFLAGVANLDGAQPSAVFSRGYYTRAVIAAWDWRNGQLTSRWVFDTNVAGSAAEHQGAHWFSTADVNNDGKDDIVYGAATIKHDGTLLYSTGLCHGDALHVGKFNPNLSGLQVYMVHETPSCYGAYGAEMHDAATGAILWGVDGLGGDIGRGICLDLDPNYAGEECWASGVGGVRSATGVQITTTSPTKPAAAFAVWWDGDLGRETLDSDRIDHWNATTLGFDRLLNGNTLGAYSINGTKATPVVSADLFGDWREEIVWRNADNTALMIFSSTYTTDVRINTLMHNPQYRAQVANQNAGYNQPPHPSFFLGYGMGTFVQVPVHTPIP